MFRYVIIPSETNAGRGIRWLNLYRFLAIYHGRNSIRALTPSELRDAGIVESDRC